MLQQWKARIRKLPRHRGLEERRRFNRYVRNLRNERSSLRNERSSLRNERSLRAGFGNNKIPSIIDAGRKLETLLTKKLICEEDMTLQDYQNTLETTLYHIHNYITQFINVYTLIRTGYTLQMRKEVVRRINPYKDKQTVLDCYNAWLNKNNISDKGATETFTPEALEYVRADAPLKKYHILFQYIGFLLFLRDGTNNTEPFRGDAPIVATCMLDYVLDDSKQEIKPEEKIKRVFHCLLQTIKSRPRPITVNVEKSLYGLIILTAMMKYKTSLQECIDEFVKEILPNIATLNAERSLRVVNRMPKPERDEQQTWLTPDTNVYQRR